MLHHLPLYITFGFTMQNIADNFCNHHPDCHKNFRHSVTNIFQRARVLLFPFNEVYNILEALRCSQQCNWGFRSCGKWWCVDGWLVPGVLKEGTLSRVKRTSFVLGSQLPYPVHLYHANVTWSCNPCWCSYWSTGHLRMTEKCFSKHQWSSISKPLSHPRKLE